MKIDLKNMDTYRFVIYVLVFVLIFTLIFTMQMKSLMNIQKKMIEKFFEKPKTTTSTYTPSNYTKSTQDEVKKYSNFEY